MAQGNEPTTAEGGMVEAAVVTEAGVEMGSLVTSRLAASYRLARAILLDDSEAEDVVQDACLIAWRRQSSLRDPTRFEPWFQRIVVNLCRDRIRRRRRVVEIAAAALDPEAPADAARTARDYDLDRALGALDVDHRVVVVMRYWQDRTVDDIAARLGIPSGTVKSRLHHALLGLRASLEAPDGRP